MILIAYHTLVEGLVVGGPKVLEPGVEIVMREITGKRQSENLGLGIMGRALSAEGGVNIPNRLERK
jgi:hypothetical protein